MKRNNLILSLILVLTVVSLNAQSTSKLKLIAGTGNAGFKDGKYAEMDKPIRLAPFTDNSVIFADINNHAIRIVTLKGKVTTIAGGPGKKGHKDGTASEAKFKSPHGVAYDKQTGNIYVSEAGNHVIRLITPVYNNNEKYIVSTFAGVPEKPGYKDGPLNQAQFISPHAVVLTSDGGIIVADIGNTRIRLIKNGKVTTIAGSGEPGQLDGKPLEATFKYPMDLVMNRDTVLIADAGTNMIRKLIPGKEVTTIKLKGELNTPHGIAVDDSGVIYIADMGTHRILSIDKECQVKSIAGTGEAGSELEQLDKPAAVLFHSDCLWIADLNNHQIKVLPLKD